LKFKNLEREICRCGDVRLFETVAD